MKTTKEMIEVMQAFERGENVEFIDPSCLEDSWAVISCPSWSWHQVDYRIAKPEPKKVKLLAYLACSELRWFTDVRAIPTDWYRIPSLDKEVEIEE